jgi:hypothetical protein
MTILSPEQFEEKKIRDQEIMQQTALDHQELISQHDDLFREIVSDLETTVNNLNTLQSIHNQIIDLGKETSQLVFSLVGFEITGNLASTRTQVENARKSIIERIK